MTATPSSPSSSSSSSSSSLRNASAASSAAASAMAAARAAVASAVASVLGPGIGDATPLADAGLDSLGAVDLRNALARSLKNSKAATSCTSDFSSMVELPVTLAYDHPTPAALTAFVAGQLLPLMMVEREAEEREEEVKAKELVSSASSASASLAVITAVPPSLAPLASPSSSSSSSRGGTVIEIVAASASLAGADTCGATSNDSLAALWRSASSPHFDGTSSAPAERWGCGDAVDALYCPVATPGKTYVRHACWLSGISGVDAQALRLSPPEAAALDPQARALVEHCASVVVDCSPSSSFAAASSSSSNARPVGLYVGVMHMEFLQATSAMTAGAPATPAGASGNGMDFLAGRASYCLGLSGAAATVHTACSSSLVAVHLAREGLDAGRERRRRRERRGGGGPLLFGRGLLRRCRRRGGAPHAAARNFRRHLPVAGPLSLRKVSPFRLGSRRVRERGRGRRAAAPAAEEKVEREREEDDNGRRAFFLFFLFFLLCAAPRLAPGLERQASGDTLPVLPPPRARHKRRRCLWRCERRPLPFRSCRRSKVQRLLCLRSRFSPFRW